MEGCIWGVGRWPGVPVVEVRLLGPVQAVQADREVPLGGPRQRAVLALLVLEAGRVVPAGEGDGKRDTCTCEEKPASIHGGCSQAYSGLRNRVPRSGDPDELAKVDDSPDDVLEDFNSGHRFSPPTVGWYETSGCPS